MRDQRARRGAVAQQQHRQARKLFKGDRGGAVTDPDGNQPAGANPDPAGGQPGVRPVRLQPDRAVCAAGGLRHIGRFRAEHAGKGTARAGRLISRRQRPAGGT